MGPPITYLVDGKQYIALAGGQGVVQGRGGPGGGPGPGGPGPGGPGAPGPGGPGAAPAGAAGEPGGGGRGGNPPAPPPTIMPKLLVFELDGKAALPDPVQ
jgi:hypothetical protein